jgi:hypothetical protein
MLSRRIGSASLVIAAFACPACHTVDRAGQDALVVGTFPIHALTTPYQRTAAAVSDDNASPWVSPIIFAGHFAEDVGVTVISAGDLGISPALGFVEMVSDEDEKLGPLRMYTFEEFPPEFHKTRARNVESDVAKGAAQAAVAVAVFGVLCVAAYYGHPINSSGWANSPPTAPSDTKKQPKPSQNVP